MRNKELTVCVIEDDEIFSRQLQSRLSAFVADDLILFESVNRALSYIEESKPSLILLDNKLPYITGGDALKLIKELSPNSTIVLMSASFSVQEIANAIREKADFVLEKQEITADKLNEIVESALRSKAENKSIWRIMEVFNGRLSGLGKKNVAIVEDDEIFRMQLEHELLKSKKDLNVSTFGRASEFYEELKTYKPDVLFLDYSLPDGSGKSVAQHTYMKSPQTIIIIISAQDDPQIVAELRELGVYGYIVKDLEWKEEIEHYIDELAL